MIRNAGKAIREHHHLAGPLDRAYVSSPKKTIPSKEILNRKEITPLKLSHTFADHIGPREAMEDAHFFIEIEQGTLLGVFDGHGGKEVADYASQEFQKRFSAVLKAHSGDVFRSFEVLLHEIHQEVAQKPAWNEIGSTAVVSFIDKETHQIITATLGDSEANLYRNNKSIPLSLVRDWTSRKDAIRLETAMNYKRGSVAAAVQRGVDPKSIRWNGDLLNVSRAIGDIDCTGSLEKPGVIHKPLITINKVQKGDILILSCDGVKDYTEEQEIVNLIMNRTARTISKWIFHWFMKKIFSWEPKSLALELVDHAIHTSQSDDNVTVVAVEVS
jgi:serine/threonine protein phosphatase PrpC